MTGKNMTRMNMTGKNMTGKNMTGASILWECLEREGVKQRLRISRRRDSARL